MHLNELDRHEIVRGLVAVAAATATSGVTYAEVHAGLARARRTPAGSPRLNDSSYRAVVTDFDADWTAYVSLTPSTQLERRAGTLAATHFLKGYDAIQLASALELQRSVTDEVLFSTWDRALARAATAEGLSLAHEVIN